MLATRVLFLLLFFAFTLAPLANQWFELLPDTPLLGVTSDPQEVELSLKTFRTGAFQPAYEARFDAALSLRSAFVRTDNEINLRVFHQVGLNPRTSMVIGREDWLFERSYVDAFNRHDEVTAASMEPRVRRLALLQRYLESRGSTLLVVITPSKPLLYPEYLPPGMIIGERQRVPTNYEKFVPLLVKHGIHFVDGQGYLQENKYTSEVPYFGSNGTHWNDPASCEVTSLVMASIASRLETNLPKLVCAPYWETTEQRRIDVDILQLVNLWDEERQHQPVQRARPRLVPRKPKPLSILGIGGSFSRAMAKHYRLYRHDYTFFRYYTSQEHGNRRRPLDPKKLDWDALFSKDVILVEINAEIVPQVGFGFLEDAEREILARQGPSAMSDTGTHVGGAR